MVDLVRLLTNRNIYILFTEYESLDHNRPLFPQRCLLSSASLRVLSEQAIIRDADAQQLSILWDRLDNSPNAPIVRLAFSRWSVTSERLSDEDKLIDYWIALESLFTPDASQEVTYRSAIRIAAFLGDAAEVRKKIYDDIRHSYEWRSALVHGGRRESGRIKKLRKNVPLRSIADNTRSYLREAIIRILRSDECFNPTNIEHELLGR